jgi:hypothetical protein
MPPRKQMVPLSFCFLAKNWNVFAGPMMSVSPPRKRIYMEHVQPRKGREEG